VQYNIVLLLNSLNPTNRKNFFLRRPALHLYKAVPAELTDINAKFMLNRQNPLFETEAYRHSACFVFHFLSRAGRHNRTAAHRPVRGKQVMRDS